LAHTGGSLSRSLAAEERTSAKAAETKKMTHNGRVQRVTISYCALLLAALMIGYHLSISALPLQLSGQGQELSEVRESKHEGRGREAQPEHRPQADDGEIRRDKRAVAVSSSNGTWNGMCIFRNGSHGGLLSIRRSCLPRQTDRDRVEELRFESCARFNPKAI
jgi:hypothetical protein